MKDARCQSRAVALAGLVAGLAVGLALLTGCGSGGGTAGAPGVDEFANRRGVWYGTWFNTDANNNRPEAGTVSITVSTPSQNVGMYEGVFTDTATGKRWTLRMFGGFHQFTAENGRSINADPHTMQFQADGTGREHLLIVTQWIPILPDIGMTRGSLSFDLTKSP